MSAPTLNRATLLLASASAVPAISARAEVLPQLVPSAKCQVPSKSNLALGTCHLELAIKGYLFARDFPDVVRELRLAGRHGLGLSYEIADARVADVRAPIWQLDDVTFTGAAVLRRAKAAY